MTRSGFQSGITLTIIMAVIFISAQIVEASEEDLKIYTLAESVMIALENNFSIKAKEEKISESEFAEKEAKAGFYPELSMSYSYTRQNDVSTLGLPTGMKLQTGDKNNYQWKGTVTQPIFTGYALTSLYELAKLGIDQSKTALELEKLELALKVKEAYFNILKADASVDVAKSAVDSLEAHRALAKNFYDAGMTPVNDLLKAEVELANAQHNLVQAQNDANMARFSFNVLLSRTVDEPFKIEDILQYKPETIDYEVYLSKALNARPEIRSLDLMDAQIDQQIILSKSKSYPEAAFTFDYIKAGDTPLVSGSDFQDANSWQATFGLSWKFWDWDKTKNSVRQNESMKRQLSQTRKILEDSIKLELKKAILDLKEAEQKVPTAEKAVDQAEENLRVSEQRYKVQATTSTEVLDAQTLLSQTRMNYYSALYDHNLAKAGLLRAVGEY